MQTLVDAIRHNCDIVDARHGSDYGICTYLLKMRELYRWQHGLPLGARLAKDQVGDWLSARESHLESLEDADFVRIPVGSASIDPFDAESVNAALAGRGLIYSAGLVDGARPQFFLAELEQEQRADNGFVLRVSGRELARCLNAPPAMSRGPVIFLRRESLRRYLWEKYEAWLWSRPDNAMARAIAHYPFESALDDALDAMSDAEMAVIEAHERGEHQAGLDLGDGWEAMLLDLSLTPAEIMARAVRDHLADCSHTLPMLMEDGREPSLHLFMANLGAMRKQLFPALQRAYGDWLNGGDRSAFAGPVRQGAQHWLGLARRVLVLHRKYGSEAVKPIVAEVEAAFL